MSAMLALLCSGQGAQHAGMFDLLRGCRAAEPVFKAAAIVLGQNPRDFVTRASPDELFSNRVGQILCCTQALSLCAALDDAKPRSIVIAGYSVGELAAWGCAGVFGVPETLELAAHRAAAMDAAAPPDGGLAGIVGLRASQLRPILDRHGAAIAIVNGLDSFVIGGREASLAACCLEAARSGARHVVRLRVSVPSHTALLSAAMAPFRDALRLAHPKATRPEVRLISSTDGGVVSNVDDAADRLAAQVCTVVNWAACLESCRAAGANRVLETGPGTALSHMAEDLFRSCRVRAADEFRSIQGLRDWLSAS